MTPYRSVIGSRYCDPSHHRGSNDMSYGHADKIARLVTGTRAAGEGESAPAIDPALYRREDVRRILADRDIAGLFRVLKDDAGITQRTIAELTGMQQSEVSEILKGRQVRNVTVLERIAAGLGIPRELLGLSYGAYPEGVTVADPPEGVSVEMLRRRLIELGAGLAVAAPAAKLAELLERLELPDPSPVPLPSALSGVHVAKVRDLIRRLGEAHRAFGPDPEVCSAATSWVSRLLGVPGPEPVKRALMIAVSELHLQAGWAGVDAGLYDRAMHHCGRALKLATEAGDTYCQAVALNRAGLATVEHGDPNEGLKLLQVGTVTALDVPPDEPRAVMVGGSGRAGVQAIALVDSATALADLDEPEKANTDLARARELWQPTSADTHGDLDRPAAILELERGHLDAAEPFAVASVRRWEGVSQNGHANSCVVLATIHVRAGEPNGLRLAHSAISAANKISSVRVRRRLVPLADALDARPNGDAKQLARMARQVASTRV